MWPHYRIGAMSARRPPIVGRYTAEEVELATRNRGLPLEALRYDVTPAGLHYLLVHFDIPDLDAVSWRLRVAGNVARALELSLDDIRSRPPQTMAVTLECAGNGRARLLPAQSASRGSTRPSARLSGPALPSPPFWKTPE